LYRIKVNIKRIISRQTVQEGELYLATREKSKALRTLENKVNVQKAVNTNEKSSASSLIIPYLVLRNTIGLLGTALPFLAPTKLCRDFLTKVDNIAN